MAVFEISGANTLFSEFILKNTKKYGSPPPLTIFCITSSFQFTQSGGNVMRDPWIANMIQSYEIYITKSVRTIEQQTFKLILSKLLFNSILLLTSEI